MKVSTTSHKWIGLIAVLILLSGWQIAATLIKLPLILPSPRATFIQITALIVKGEFWHHLGATLGRGLFGFGLSLIVGVGVGLVCGRVATVAAFFRPVIVLIRSTPSMSLILLALIWFRGEVVPVFVIFLVVFPIITQNMIEGVRSVNLELREMVQLYRVKKTRVLTHLYVPTVIPFLAAGISAGLGITWKVLIAAEVLSYPSWGIGVQMDSARVYLQTDRVFAWTVVVVAIGLVFDYLLDYWVHQSFAAPKGSQDGQG
jgi:NitT/TauT family transport system permease protein